MSKKGFEKTWSDAKEKFKSVDFKDPKVILTIVIFIALPYVAKHYFSLGLILGITFALGILFIYEKFPPKVREWCDERPLLTDVILSSIAIGTFGGYFGEGLVLGIGAAVCAVTLSVCLPHMNKVKETQPETN